jgi:hypothetical protein
LSNWEQKEEGIKQIVIIQLLSNWEQKEEGIKQIVIIPVVGR